MDYTQPGFWIAIGVGGSLVAALSTVQQLTSKNPADPSTHFRPKAVVRDFCFGAFLTAIVYMFLPESVLSMVSAGQTALTSSMEKVANAASKVTSVTARPSMTGGGGLEDIELRIGPARF
jgi:hypothetical protein